jgi:DNA-directed RNA polymerase beta' subunit
MNILNTTSNHTRYSLYRSFYDLPVELRDRIGNEIATEFKKIIHFNIKDIASLLNISENQVRKLKLKGTRIGNRIKPSLQDLLDYIDENKTEIKTEETEEYRIVRQILNEKKEKILLDFLDKNKVGEDGL